MRWRSLRQQTVYIAEPWLTRLLGRMQTGLWLRDDSRARHPTLVRLDKRLVDALERERV